MPMKISKNIPGVTIRGSWKQTQQGLEVDGDVVVHKLTNHRIPVVFSSVSGSFDCSCVNLQSLQGCPTKVGGDFDCSWNNLKSLNGCPKVIGGSFNCSHNQLTSLVDGPTSVGADYICSRNQVSALCLAGMEIPGNFICANNQIDSLEGAPQRVGGYMDCAGNRLNTVSLPAGLHGILYLGNNPGNLSDQAGCAWNSDMLEESLEDY